MKKIPGAPDWAPIPAFPSKTRSRDTANRDEPTLVGAPRRKRRSGASDHLQRLAALGITIDQFAEWTGVHPHTIQGWGKPRSGRRIQAVPLWVGLLLRDWELDPDLIPGRLDFTQELDRRNGYRPHRKRPVRA